MSKAPVRVRGMNAAASHSTPPQGEPNESVFAFLDDDTTELSTVRTKEHVGGVGASRVAENHRRQRFPHASVRQLTLAVALLAAGLLVAKSRPTRSAWTSPRPARWTRSWSSRARR
jgi:hypothetical protein